MTTLTFAAKRDIAGQIIEVTNPETDQVVAEWQPAEALQQLAQLADAIAQLELAK